MTSPISVVIPTYKAAAYIRDTVDSVFAQTRRPQEVVVVDDASPDDTPAIVEAIARTSPVPVRLLRMTRNTGGPGAPLNSGIRAAAGPYIATLDQDDHMRPQRLERQLACAELDDRLGLIIGRVNPIVEASVAVPEYIRVIEEEARQIPSQPLGEGMRRLRSSDAYNALVRMGCFGFTCSAFLFRKTVWKQVSGFDAKIRSACDFAFMESLLRRHDVGVVDEIVADWRLHEASLTNFAGLLVKDRDRFRILSKFKASLLDPPEKEILERDLAYYYRDGGYKSRQQGRYADAARYYLVGLRPNLIPLHAAASILKLFPHYCVRRFRNADLG